MSETRNYPPLLTIKVWKQPLSEYVKNAHIEQLVTFEFN